MAVLVLLAIAYATKTSAVYSRIWMGLWALGVAAWLLGSRAAVFWWLRRRQELPELAGRVAVVGAAPVLGTLMARLHGGGAERVRVVLDIDIGDLPANSPELARALERVAEVSAEREVDDVIIALAGGDKARIETALNHFQHLDCTIGLCLEQAFLGVPVQSEYTVGGVPVLKVATRPLEGWGEVVKWLEDKVLGLVLTALALPFMILVVIAIRMESPGDALFRQDRLGRGNRRIPVLKFRTMYVDRESPGGLSTTQGDPRVTRVGRFLRRFSLDELPQLFNVLGGTMSLVGPRPHAVSQNWEFADMAENYWVRHRMKPGITGWAQVNGFRGNATKPEAIQGRVRHDVYYVENWSFTFDLYILLKTVFHVIRGKNAY